MPTQVPLPDFEQFDGYRKLCTESSDFSTEHHNAEINFRKAEIGCKFYGLPEIVKNIRSEELAKIIHQNRIQNEQNVNIRKAYQVLEGHISQRIATWMNDIENLNLIEQNLIKELEPLSKGRATDQGGYLDKLLSTLISTPEILVPKATVQWDKLDPAGWRRDIHAIQNFPSEQEAPTCTFSRKDGKITATPGSPSETFSEFSIEESAHPEIYGHLDQSSGNRRS